MAGLYDIFNNGFYSMGIFQYALSVTGRNMQNVASLEYHSLNNIFTTNPDGTTVLTVIRLEDSVLQGQIFDQTALAGQSTETKSLYNNLTAIFGLDGAVTPPDNHATFPLANQWNALLLGFQTVETDPVHGGNSVLSAARNLANSINDLSQKLSDSRAQGELNINTDVNAINKDLKALHKINESLSSLTPGTDTGQISVLKDRRDALISDLSKYMNVQVKEKNNGVAQIFTIQGFELLDTNQVHLLGYKSISSAFGNVDIQNISGGLPAGTFSIQTPNGIPLNIVIHSGESASDLVRQINQVVGLRAEIDQKGQLKIMSNLGKITISGSSAKALGFQSKTYTQTAKELIVDGSPRILTGLLTNGQLAADMNYIRDDWYARNSMDPYIGQIGKLESQLNSVVHLLMDQGPHSFESTLEGSMAPVNFPKPGATTKEIGQYWQYSLFVPKDYEPGPPPSSNTFPGNNITSSDFKVNPSASSDWFRSSKSGTSSQDSDHPWGGTASEVVKFMNNPILPKLNPPYMSKSNPESAFPGISTDGVGWNDLISTIGGALSTNEQTVIDDFTVRHVALQQLNSRMLNAVSVNQIDEQDHVILYNNSYNALASVISTAKKMEQVLVGLAGA